MGDEKKLSPDVTQKTLVIFTKTFATTGVKIRVIANF